MPDFDYLGFAEVYRRSKQGRAEPAGNVCLFIT